MELPDFLILCVAGLSMLIGIGCALATIVDEMRNGSDVADC
jgi:hypothetical protein